jgi:hypothetical protein
MDKKTVGIISTIAAVLLCGCPGLFLCVFGAASAAGAGTWELGSDVGEISPGVGVAILCVGLIFIVIPIAVGFFTLRNKSVGDEEEVIAEPIPEEDL